MDNDSALIIDDNTHDLIASSEINIQIATAKKYPRSIKTFVNQATEMATLNEQIAGECIYALPRGGKVIAGASVRFAEIVMSSWGNCRAGARPLLVDDKTVTSQGVFHDLERNVCITMEAQRSILTKHGKRFNDDMIRTTSAAAASVAIRNATLRGIPKAFWSSIYAAVEQTIKGNAKTLIARRDDALNYLIKFGVTPDMVLTALDKNGIEDIGLDDLVTLRGIATALKDGETTVEKAFPNVDKDTGEVTPKAYNPTPPEIKKIATNQIDDDSFNKKCIGWAKVIKSGTQSHQQLILTINKRYTLSDNQIKIIESIKV